MQMPSMLKRKPVNLRRMDVEEESETETQAPAPPIVTPRATPKSAKTISKSIGKVTPSDKLKNMKMKSPAKSVLDPEKNSFLLHGS
jgi:hypothetical protein